MNVKELIAALEKVNPQLPVVVYDSDEDLFFEIEQLQVGKPGTDWAVKNRFPDGLRNKPCLLLKEGQ